MTRFKVLLILAFLLVFGAGTVVGIVQGRTTVAPSPVPPSSHQPTMPETAVEQPSGREPGGRRGGGPRDPGSWMIEYLELTPDQQEKIRAVWTEVMEVHRPQIEERRRELERTRDDALLNLLTPVQRAEYDRIQSDVKQQLAQLDEERREMYRRAQEDTAALLTPEQKLKHEEWMNKMREQWERGRDRDRNRGGGDGDGRRRDRERDHDRDRADHRDAPISSPATAPAVE